MAYIDLTNYNALVDDDGSNTVGTLWTKAKVADVILTPVETALSTFVAWDAVQTTTSTGTQNNFALTTHAKLLRANNATSIALTGLTAGDSGQYLTIASIGAGTVTLADQDTGSTAANRIITGTGATLTLGAGRDSALLIYDATTARWRVVQPRPLFRCVAYHNTTQSLSDGVLTALTLNAEDSDLSTMHDTVTNNSRIVIPTGGDGFYQCVGSTSFAANATGNRQVIIYKNGSALQYQVTSSVAAGVATAIQVVYVGAAVAGDYFEVWGYQNSGGALNAGSATRTVASSLSVVRL